MELGLGAAGRPSEKKKVGNTSWANVASRLKSKRAGEERGASAGLIFQAIGFGARG
jgi:hypothetical protein